MPPGQEDVRRRPPSSLILRRYNGPATFREGQVLAQRRFHYEQAFEHYLRANGIPYVAVDEAKRALAGRNLPVALKSFDFVVYSERGANLLIDVKGRKHAGRSGRSLQNWVTRDDVRSLEQWAGIFGEGFRPAFAFLFWCEAQPPDALFHEIFEFGERWYAVQAVRLKDYTPHMRKRSAKWDTLSVPAKAFDQIARPLKELL
ncbi:MAG: HYExAFE family protein [Phycisphaeraceae bacterium]